jgi:serine protease Do
VRPPKHLDLDIALIPLEEELDRRPFSLSDDCELLDEVVVFGYPPISQSDDAYLVVNRGEVSARPSLLGSGQRVIVVSCLLRGGHSGGPVVNRRGAVVGIVSSASPSRCDQASGGEIG